MEYCVKTDHLLAPNTSAEYLSPLCSLLKQLLDADTKEAQTFVTLQKGFNFSSVRPWGGSVI